MLFRRRQGVVEEFRRDRILGPIEIEGIVEAWQIHFRFGAFLGG